MQAIANHGPFSLLRLIAGVSPVVAALLVCGPCIAQPMSDSLHIVADSGHLGAGAAKNARTNEVTTFEELNMPIEMVVRFTQLTPRGMLLFRDEFQVMRDGDYGQEIDMIKVWFIDDHMIGYVIETPLERSQGAPITKWKFDIPVVWCCRPGIEGHTEHCANTIAEVRLDEGAYKCTGWHMKLPPPLPPEPKPKLQKVKKKKNAKADDALTANNDKPNGQQKKVKKNRSRKERKVALPETN